MISKQEIQRVAALARIKLSGEEIERLAGDLTNIVDYFQKMQNLDTKEVDLNLSRGENEALREDDSKDSGIQDLILDNAPAREERFFKVKSVL